MTKISIKQFLKLRKQLTEERAYIVKRLKEVDAALGSFEITALSPAVEEGKKRSPKPISERKIQNSMSLKEAIIKVLGKQMMTKEQILEGVQKQEYRFRTTKPLGTIAVVLYGKDPKFKRKDGKFGVV